MKLKNIRELFTLKGLWVSIVLLGFSYVVGFLAGWLVEKVNDKEGAKMPFIDLSIPNTVGVFLAVGGWLYMVWLLAQRSGREEKGSD